MQESSPSRCLLIFTGNAPVSPFCCNTVNIKPMTPLNSEYLFTPTSKPPYERWLWIELIGFDLHLADYGVNRFLENAGFIPTVVTLLLAEPEFVHGHNERLDRIFTPDICSYGGHDRNEERHRQDWTARHLLGLITTLREKGIHVFFSHFDGPVSGWLSEHPELLFIDRHGAQGYSMTPYKRLASGESYQDYYLPRLLKVIKDYGFDGYHAGDGLAHPRIPIYEGDFSDDTLRQYQDWLGEKLPCGFSQAAGLDPNKISARAEWIWKERRLSWIQFHCARTTAFWKQAAEVLHGEGKELLMNSAWTRDPFEAIYRYGVDYRALSEAGVDGFIAETAAAAHEYGGDLPYGEEGLPDWDPTWVIKRFATKLHLLRATAPKARIIFMNAIKDSHEAWNGIHHAPTNLESEIFSHTALFSINRAGQFETATSGVVSVLSDGLKSHEWEWITDRWNLGYALKPEGILGAALYWSDAYREGLVEDYVATRRCPLDRIVWQLSAAGAPLLAVVRSENLAAWKGTLLVVHPHLLPTEEWSALMARKDISVITVGGPAPADPAPRQRRAYYGGADAFEISIYSEKANSSLEGEWPAPEPFEPSAAQDSFFWLVDLASRKIPDAVLQSAANWIISEANGVRVLQNPKDIQAWAYKTGLHTLRVYVRNNAFYYRNCTVDVGVPCERIVTLSQFPKNTVVPNGSIFRLKKMAGKSMSVLEIEISPER